MNTSNSTHQGEVALQERVWDTYLQGLLTYAYTPRPVMVDEPGEHPAEQTEQEGVPDITSSVERIPELPPPEWAETPFQCIFFTVSEMALATPLIALREIVKYNHSLLKKLPGQPDWSRGIIDHRGEVINLVDPGTLIRTHDYDESQKPYRYIILTDIPSIGFLCHDITDMSRLDPENIRWYQNRSKRPWLAGIHKQRLCTVIDIQRLLPTHSSTFNTDNKTRFI